MIQTGRVAKRYIAKTEPLELNSECELSHSGFPIQKSATACLNDVSDGRAAHGGHPSRPSSVFRPQGRGPTSAYHAGWRQHRPVVVRRPTYLLLGDFAGEISCERMIQPPRPLLYLAPPFSTARASHEGAAQHEPVSDLAVFLRPVSIDVFMRCSW